MPVSTVVVMDPKQLAAVLRSNRGPVTRHLIREGERVKQEARRIAPISKNPRSGDEQGGNLRDHIVKRVANIGGDPAVLVVCEVPYALWVHEGTVAHVIRPRKAGGRLVFYWPKAGRVVSFPKVNHPGTKPNRFLVKALGVLR